MPVNHGRTPFLHLSNTLGLTSLLFVITILLSFLSTTTALPDKQPFIATVSLLPSSPLVRQSHQSFEFDDIPEVDGAATALVPTPYVGLNWSHCAFDIYSTYLACVGQYSVPLKCMVRFTGHRISSLTASRNVSSSCSFSGGDKLELCNTYDLTGLNRLGVEILGVDKEAIFSTVQLDDVRGAVYQY
ncbi:MAG: hypothetical protein Q9220_000760 [cf. Caloplaca sp. 1 TL-2023]